MKKVERCSTVALPQGSAFDLVVISLAVSISVSCGRPLETLF